MGTTSMAINETFATVDGYDIDNMVRIVGTFEDYADFYRGNNAAPYQNMVQLIKDNVGTLPDNAHIMDIGSGGAFAVDLLVDQFEQISLIEPNPYLRKKWFNKSWINDNEHILHLYPLSIEETIKTHSIQPNSIDAIIIYHSIYHFDLEILAETIKSILSYLKPDGICILSVIDDKDEFAKLYPTLSPNYKLSRNVINILDKMENISYKKKYETYVSDMGWDDSLSLIQWLFVQDCMNPNYFPNGLTTKELNAVTKKCQKYIQQHSKVHTVEDETGNTQTMYQMFFTSIHFTITKNV